MPKNLEVSETNLKKFQVKDVWYNRILELLQHFLKLEGYSSLTQVFLDYPHVYVADTRAGTGRSLALILFYLHVFRSQLQLSLSESKLADVNVLAFPDLTDRYPVDPMSQADFVLNSRCIRYLPAEELLQDKPLPQSFCSSKEEFSHCVKDLYILALHLLNKKILNDAAMNFQKKHQDLIKELQ